MGLARQTVRGRILAGAPRVSPQAFARNPRDLRTFAERLRPRRRTDFGFEGIFEIGSPSSSK